MKRPTSVLVFGILNLAFAAMGVLGLLMTAALLFAPQSPAGQNNPDAAIDPAKPRLRDFPQNFDAGRGHCFRGPRSGRRGPVAAAGVGDAISRSSMPSTP